MKEAVDIIKVALSKQKLAEHLSHYFVKDGYVMASDGRMTAGTPVNLDGGIEFLVPGEELELLLSKFGTDPVVTIADNLVSLRQGRLQGTIAIQLPGSLFFHMPPEDAQWLKPCPDLLPALKTARPFISDNAMQDWALSAYLQDNRILATTNRNLVEVDCEDLHAPDVLLPVWAVDFVLARDAKLMGMLWETNWAGFLWADGTWMTTALINGSWPPQATDLLENLPVPEWEISTEWREAYAKVSSMVKDGDPFIIGQTRMEFRRGQAWVAYEMESPCPEAGASQWDPKFLDAVVAVATHLDLTTWPKPAAFAGNGIKGLVVGRLG